MLLVQWLKSGYNNLALQRKVSQLSFGHRWKREVYIGASTTAAHSNCFKANVLALRLATFLLWVLVPMSAVGRWALLATSYCWCFIACNRCMPSCVCGCVWRCLCMVSHRTCIFIQPFALVHLIAVAHKPTPTKWISPIQNRTAWCSCTFVCSQPNTFLRANSEIRSTQKHHQNIQNPEPAKNTPKALFQNCRMTP